MSVILLIGLALTACSGGGGGGGGGSSTNAIAGLGSYAPASVARASSYAWTQSYAPGTPGSVAALGVAPGSSSVFAAVAGAARIDRIDTGFTSEVTLPFDPASFAAVGTGFLAGTRGTTPQSGQVYRRDPIAGTWNLDLAGQQMSCVVTSFQGTPTALQGQDGSTGVLSQYAGGWADVASLPSCVPLAAAELAGELWVGGRASNATGPRLLHGSSTFAERTLPVMVGQGQRASVNALSVLGTALFASVRVEDAKTGAPISGTVFYVGATDSVTLLSLQQEAPVGFAVVDGTIYVGTTSGRVLWLDTSGRFQPEAALPPSSGLTAIVATQGQLAVALDTASGPIVLLRQAVTLTLPPTPGPTPGPTPPGPPAPPPPPPPPPPTAQGMAYRDVTPRSGFVTGFWDVLIVGNNFENLTSVTIGGAPLIGLQYASTEIRGRCPPGTAGTAAIVIVSSTRGTLNVPAVVTFTPTVSTAPGYQASVLPIITTVCNTCHSSAGRAQLSPYASIMAGTVGGTGLVSPGNADMNSYICVKIDPAIGGTTATMSGYPTAAQRATIEAWIQGGAKP